MAEKREQISYNGTDVPIYRAAMREVFIALKPPEASPYVMAPRAMEPEEIVQFFAKHVAEVEELRADMQKRFAKATYGKCRYMTGDVAYVLGRPFQLRVYPLGSRKMKSAARGRATAKYSVNGNVSLITLYVVHPKNYDEAKVAFNSYAEAIILKNARGLADDFAKILAPGTAAPPVRMRAMRGRWTSSDAGALWLSTDIIPYPVDCLVYAIWKELEKRSELPPEEMQAHLQRIVPGWENARRILAERPAPYCYQ
ncbi:MAG TPA: hypothetical protein DCP91_09485 [Eggerthellaceae bacterium]|nr:hypothetical protein [Eggerthellaceae bacterium]